MQTLIDDGRITEAEARTHPHRNLILKAIDSVHEVEPDLFHVDLEEGDRVLLCSDGILSLTDARIADIMGSGSADYAAVELVRAALEAGSHDNVTCIVADVVGPDHPVPDDLVPLLVGAAADLPRRGRSSLGMSSLFRGHRAGDTGELEPVQAEIPNGRRVRHRRRPPDRPRGRALRAATPGALRVGPPPARRRGPARACSGSGSPWPGRGASSSTTSAPAPVTTATS